MQAKNRTLAVIRSGDEATLRDCNDRKQFKLRGLELIDRIQCGKAFGCIADPILRGVPRRADRLLRTTF